MNKEQETFKFAITSEQNKNHPEIKEHIDYQTHNGGKWRAIYQNGCFTHSREGKIEQSHQSDRLDYLEPDGRPWRVFIENGKCVCHAVSGGSETKVADQISYRGWDGKGYTAVFIKPGWGIDQLEDALKESENMFDQLKGDNL